MPLDSGLGPSAHSPKVRCKADQIPFAGYVRLAPQAELSEATNVLDPSEHWFDNNFSATVRGLTLGSGEFVFHAQGGGVGCRDFWCICLPLATERDDHVHLHLFGSFEIRFGSVSS